MFLLRFLVIAFNVAVVGYLVYRMLEVARVMMPPWKKTFIIVGGVLLLLAPLGMFLRFFAPTTQYFVIYPVAIAVYLYMIREL
jgi:hypothetical protein